MSIHDHTVFQAGRPVHVRLTIIGATAHEAVWRTRPGEEIEMLHEADFPVSSLGGAREDYLRVMTASVLDAETRALRLGIPLADALSGRTGPAAGA